MNEVVDDKIYYISLSQCKTMLEHLVLIQYNWVNEVVHAKM